mgnify:CR=1 FL=1
MLGESKNQAIQNKPPSFGRGDGRIFTRVTHAMNTGIVSKAFELHVDMERIMKSIMKLVVAMVLISSPALAVEWGQFGMQSIRMAVKDEAQSIAFYQHLGMKVGRLHHPGQQEMNWDTPAQGPGIVLVSGDTRIVPGTNNFLITVPDTMAVAKNLRAAGYDVPEPHETPNYVGVTVQDPNGNTLNLMGPLPTK